MSGKQRQFQITMIGRLDMIQSSLGVDEVDEQLLEYDELSHLPVSFQLQHRQLTLSMMEDHTVSARRFWSRLNGVSE